MIFFSSYASREEHNVSSTGPNIKGVFQPILKYFVIIFNQFSIDKKDADFLEFPACWFQLLHA